MIKHFCDWCDVQVDPRADNYDPFSEGIVCAICWDLAKRTFSGKLVLKVEVTLDGGIVEIQSRKINDH